MAHKWHPITDLDENDLNHPVHDELRHLAEVWHEQKDDLDQEQLRIFNEKLKREWAIETGQIEGVYDIDRGTTETLIERGISEQWIPHTVQNPGKTIAMLQDHQNVVDGLFDFVKGGRELSASYIKELHAALTQNQDVAIGVDQFDKKREIPMLRGKFKERPNDPTTPSCDIHQYCPPEHVDSEMDILIAMHSEHNARNVPPLAEAAWLHHRFVQIHPFQDGNGRVARCLASIVFIKAGWFPLVINRGKMREKYIDALQAADGDDLSPLIQLFAGVQRRLLNDVARIAVSVRNESEIKEVIQGAAEKLNDIRYVPDEYKPAEHTADRLMNFACQRMQSVCSWIREDLNVGDARIGILRDNDPLSRKVWTVDRIAGLVEHSPDINAYCAITHIEINDARPNSGTPAIAILCHGVGPEYHGGIAYVAVYGTVYHPQKLINKPFYADYKESTEQAQKRFEPWMDGVLLAGLRLWRESL